MNPRTAIPVEPPTDAVCAPSKHSLVCKASGFQRLATEAPFASEVSLQRSQNWPLVASATREWSWRQLEAPC